MIQKTLGLLRMKNFDAMILRNRLDDNISHMRRDISVKEEKTCKIKTKYTYLLTTLY